MAMAVRNEGAKVNSNINVTPMVDVMLVVLIIFMVITPMLQKGVTVDLAQTLNPKNMEDAEKEDALIVAVMKDGSIFFDTQKVQAEELLSKCTLHVPAGTVLRIETPGGGGWGPSV